MLLFETYFFLSELQIFVWSTFSVLQCQLFTTKTSSSAVEGLIGLRPNNVCGWTKLSLLCGWRHLSSCPRTCPSLFVSPLVILTLELLLIKAVCYWKWCGMCRSLFLFCSLSITVAGFVLAGSSVLGAVVSVQQQRVPEQLDWLGCQDLASGQSKRGVLAYLPTGQHCAARQSQSTVNYSLRSLDIGRRKQPLLLQILTKLIMHTVRGAKCRGAD